MEGKIVKVLIGEFGVFELFDQPHKATRSGGQSWRNLHLTARGRKKRSWWFGWNGERISRSTDAGHLAENEPDVYAWVIETLKTHNFDEPPT